MTQELRKLAEAATQGPWIAGDDEDSDYYLVGPPSFDRVVTNPVVQLHALNNAEFIAAANPAAIIALLDRVEKAEKDAARVDWLQTKLFTNRWNGVVGKGCFTQWSMAPDYRHSLTTMQTGDIEIDFRGAIDNAMEASK